MVNKVKETKHIDSWICLYCSWSNNDTSQLDLDMGYDNGTCIECGKKSKLYFSIEYTAFPLDENGEEI